MPLVAAQIAPHGFALIHDLSDDAEGGLATRSAMETAGRLFADAGVDVIVLAGPHGVRVDGAICIDNVARGAGSLTRGDRTVEMNVPCDRDLALEIDRRCHEAGIPTALAGYAGNRSDQSVMPMDWGAMTPLWFNGHGQNRTGYGAVLAPVPSDDHGPLVVLITPSRTLSRQTMVDFGRVLGETFRDDPRRIGFIASCDWGHAHTENGPYAYHPAAAEVDNKVVEAVKANELLSLIDLPEEDVQNAAIDGLWQTLMLAGISQITPLHGDLISYEVPDYFGMIVATYTPTAAE